MVVTEVEEGQASGAVAEVVVKEASLQEVALLLEELQEVTEVVVTEAHTLEEEVTLLTDTFPMT